jgi:carbon storage regulator
MVADEAVSADLRRRRFQIPARLCKNGPGIGVLPGDGPVVGAFTHIATEGRKVLVLTRKPDQSIMIGDDIEITVLEVRGEQVRLGIRAPRNVAVHRKEVFEQIQQGNRLPDVHTDAEDLLVSGPCINP